MYEPDFIERNGTWLLTIVATVGTCISGLLVYVLKSRCTHIKFCGCECRRDVVSLEARDLEVNSEGEGNRT